MIKCACGADIKPHNSNRGVIECFDCNAKTRYLIGVIENALGVMGKDQSPEAHDILTEIVRKHYE